MSAHALPQPQSIAEGVRDAIASGALSLAVVFTNSGAAIITNRLQSSPGGTEAKNIGWGIGTTAAAVTDTALVTESAPTTSGGRTVGTVSRTAGTAANSKLTITGTVTAGSSLAITEEGVFDAVSAGNMLIRGVFGAVNVVSGDSVAFTTGLDFIPG